MLSDFFSFLSGSLKVEIKTQKIQYIMVIALGLYHLLQIPLYLLLFGFNPMSVVNVFSILLYLIAFGFARQKKYDKVYYIVLFEVLCYYLIATIVFGMEYGFNLYLMGVIAVIYFASYIFSTEDKKIKILPYLVVCIWTFALACVLSQVIKPVLGESDSVSSHVINWLNCITCSGAIILFLSTFLTRINMLENSLKHQNVKFKRMSMRDTLTGLVNRRYLRGKYAELEEKKERYSVIIADVDDFKQVNDNFGHETGDRVLKKVADIFKEFVRGSDYVCRWGGEEILILMPVCNKKQAKRVGVQLLEEISNAEVISKDGVRVKITITMGLADSLEGDGFMEVFRVADHRLYYGKKNGKNCIVSEDQEKHTIDSEG